MRFSMVSTSYSTAPFDEVGPNRMVKRSHLRKRIIKHIKGWIEKTENQVSCPMRGDCMRRGRRFFGLDHKKLPYDDYKRIANPCAPTKDELRQWAEAEQPRQVATQSGQLITTRQRLAIPSQRPCTHG